MTVTLSTPQASEVRLAASSPLRHSAAVVLSVLIGLVSAWWVGRHSGLQASSDTGYWLGVAGGVAMLALFVYPMRKRMKSMRRFGATRGWFVAHMILGLAGPWLILVHCGFRIGSVNAAVALLSMLVVAISGVVGRYLYVQVHHGLTGKRTELGELRAELTDGHARTQNQLNAIPQARDLLFAFEDAVVGGRWKPGTTPWPMLRLALRAHRVQRRVRHIANKSLRQVNIQGGNRAKRALRRAWLEQSRAHLSQVLRVAHFASWERLFSLWHVLHLPFVYLMVICALVHVVAVHAY